MRRALVITGFLIVLAQSAFAAGMQPSANLLPQGYVPQEIALPMPIANDDAERNGMGEADFAVAGQPMEIQTTAAMSQQSADYVDVPALTPMQQMPAPQASANPAYYTQGITTGPKAYNEGNFTFKAQ